MAKTVVTVLKKKAMKRDSKKRLIFKKVLQYLKSDTYMFAPLLSSDRSHSFPPETSQNSSTRIEENEANIEENKKLVERVGSYLKSDCYMYAPLLISQPWLDSSVCSVGEPRTDAETGRQAESMKKLTEDRKELGGKSARIIREDNRSNGYPRTRSSGVRHSILQRESVKHIVHQFHSTSVPGKSSAKQEARKPVAS